MDLLFSWYLTMKLRTYTDIYLCIGLTILRGFTVFSKDKTVDCSTYRFLYQNHPFSLYRVLCCYPSYPIFKFKHHFSVAKVWPHSRVQASVSDPESDHASSDPVPWYLEEFTLSYCTSGRNTSSGSRISRFDSREDRWASGLRNNQSFSNRVANACFSVLCPAVGFNDVCTSPPIPRNYRIHT